MGSIVAHDKGRSSPSSRRLPLAPAAQAGILARRRAYPVRVVNEHKIAGSDLAIRARFFLGRSEPPQWHYCRLQEKMQARALLHLRVVPRTSSYDLARTATVRGGLVRCTICNACG